MNKSLRLFTALRFNEKTIKEIALIQNQLKEIDPDAKYVNPISNFHETLYFIGTVESKNLKTIENCFKEACSIYRNKINKPIKIEFTKLGEFKRNRGNIVWLGTIENNELKTLANLIPDELDRKKIDVKRSHFTSHITLARGYNGEIPKKIKLPQNIEISKASLVWSHRNENNILIYDNIVEYPITNN